MGLVNSPLAFDYVGRGNQVLLACNVKHQLQGRASKTLENEENEYIKERERKRKRAGYSYLQTFSVLTVPPL
jgi:hypothetical protein